MLAPSERSEIARRAAAARWGKKHELPTVDQVRGWLAEAGAPLVRPASTTEQDSGTTEELALHAARVAPLDASLTRALPVFLWRNRSRLDLPMLVRMARRADESRVVGFFLDLTAELASDPSFRHVADELRPKRLSRKTFFFRSATGSPFAREAAIRNSSELARQWGFFMNMPLDSFQTLFDKFVRRDETSRAS